MNIKGDIDNMKTNIYWVVAKTKDDNLSTYSPLDSIYACLVQLDIWHNAYHEDILKYEIKDQDGNLIEEDPYRSSDNRVLAVLREKQVDISMLIRCEKEDYNNSVASDSNRVLNEVEWDLVKNWSKSSRYEVEK